MVSTMMILNNVYSKPFTRTHQQMR